MGVPETEETLTTGEVAEHGQMRRCREPEPHHEGAVGSNPTLAATTKHAGTQTQEHQTMTVYPRWYIRIRRKILDWLQGEAKKDRPGWWHRIDQEERHPGASGFEDTVRVNSPVFRWKLDQRWPPDQEKKAVPLRVWGQEVKYRVRAMGHPVWAWSWKHGTGAVRLRSITGMIARWSRGEILDLSWAANSLWSLIEKQKDWGRKLREGGRYPRTLKVEVRDSDYEKARERVDEMLGSNATKVHEEMKHGMLQSQTVINAVSRMLCLNLGWLECTWKEESAPGKGMSKTSIQIHVRRSKRLLADYELEPFSLTGWTPGRRKPRKEIIMNNTL